MSTSSKRTSTVLIACALSDRRQRWEPRLQEQFTVCGLSERNALDQVMGYLRLDVLVLDLCLPGLGGLRGLREIHELNPSTRILTLAARPTDAEGVGALEAGARGYCTRDIEAGQLRKAVDAVERGEIWIQRKLVNALVATLAGIRGPGPRAPGSADRLLSLTPRERQVGELITRGASNKEIASQLKISERTVKAHLTEMFRDLQVSDRLKLALALRAHSAVLSLRTDRTLGLGERRLPARAAESSSLRHSMLR